MEPKRKALAVRSVVIFLPFAYVVYCSVTASGPVGWVNYAQQAAFGGYYEKLSFILVAGASILLSMLILYLGSLVAPEYFSLGSPGAAGGKQKSPPAA